jgi:ankyrin repeat protein
MEKLRDWFATIETRNVEPASNKDATVSRNRSNSMSSASSFKGMNMATGSGRTQSKFSASSGDSVCVKSDAGPVNSKPLPGQENDLLLLSVSKGDNDAVRKLFGLDGVNLICKDQFHRTPLHVAVDSGHKDTAKLLLDEGAPMMWADENGRTALHLAADSGHIAIVQLLLDNKANSQATDTNGRTPLHLAIDNGNRGVALLLLEAGADAMCADKHGRTPLHLAADGGDLNNVHLLLDIGADVASLDDHGQTALHLAVEGGNKDVAQLLLESGADITLADSDGRTPLHLAACGQDAGVGASVIQLLLENGAISNLPDNFGQTPYQLAQKFGNVDSFCRWDERWKVAGPSTSSSSLVSERATEDSTSGTNNGSQHLSNSSPPMVPDSPSTCSTTGSLTSTEEQAISMIQSDENIQHLIKVLSEWFKRAIDLKLGVKVVAGADSSSTASEQLCDTSIQQSSSRRSLGRKRLYRQRPGEEDQGGGDGNGEPETKHRRISGPEKQKIACPYLKYDHAEFVAWQTCPGPGFDAIHRLKLVSPALDSELQLNTVGNIFEDGTLKNIAAKDVVCNLRATNYCKSTYGPCNPVLLGASAMNKVSCLNYNLTILWESDREITRPLRRNGKKYTGYYSQILQRT